MNVSSNSYLEPLDQIDGFLVAKMLQNNTVSSFYPFIAGVYDIFNTKSAKEARTLAKRRKQKDKRKKNS